MKTLVILLDDPDHFSHRSYFLSLMIPSWRQDGWRVTFCSDWQNLPEAELAVLHINRTLVPDAIMNACLKRYPRVINGGAGDISKRRVSHHLIGPTENYSGPVIVKTNANCGGRKERYSQDISGTVTKVVDKILPWSLTARMVRGQYPIYPNTAAVPDSIRSNEQLVVERLCCEREGELYVLRQWVFLGDRDINRISWAKQPIIKAANAIKSAPDPDGVPEFLRTRRKQLGFDYGKFDYVLLEGRPVLLDANRTPTYGKNIGPTLSQCAADLAQGIHSLP